MPLPSFPLLPPERVNREKGGEGVNATNRKRINETGSLGVFRSFVILAQIPSPLALI